MNLPEVHQTPIPGLLLLQLPVHEDARGWFKENWQREKMVAAGLPNFSPVQNNVSFNKLTGTTRGIHAEPWDKYISVIGGEVFGAWVDLRQGEGFGTSFSTTLGPGQAVFVPRGVGNGFQTLTPDTGYSYLVTEHWSPSAQANYTFLNLADEQVKIPWPIDLDRAILSEADRGHPPLDEVKPVAPRKTLVLGGNGQLGRALAQTVQQQGAYEFATRTQLDLSDEDALAAFDFSGFGVIINAAAYTQVDQAESPQGRREAWATNVSGLSKLAASCAAHDITLVHVSSDYVFDGGQRYYPEDAALSPLGVYGQTKAAGEVLVGQLSKHYVVRTSWVVGDGKNFVRTMASLAAAGTNPGVVDDQIGRLTFAPDLAAGIVHLLDSSAPYGTYNLSNDGEPASWAGLAAAIFTALGHDPQRVKPLSTSAYAQGRPPGASRPANSTLELARIKATGFTPADQFERLSAYLAEL